MAMIAAWTNFLGANRRIHPKRLPEGFAQAAANVRLGSGDFRPSRAASLVATVAVAAAMPVTIYRLNRNVVSDSGDWLWWNGLDVDVVRSMIQSDTSYEIFYTGDGAPKRTTAALALPATPAPAASRPLGIPQPDAMMSASVLVAGSGPTETRTYIDTFVTTDGLKEGAPNTLPRTVSVAGGTTMTLGSFDPVPGGYADVTLRRVYVSVSGSEYLLCAEGLASAGTLTDSLSRTTVLQSGGDASKPAWLEPPSDLNGLIALWNGMIGGFRGKELCICEPFKGWAWPAEYRIPLHDEIVGTGVWGQNWVVITTAGPYIITGSSPLNMLPNRLPFDMSCVHKRSVVSMLNGVAWASRNGICFVGEGVPASLVTEAFIDPDDWQANYIAPASTGEVLASRFENECIFFHSFFGGGAAASFSMRPSLSDGIVTRTEVAVFERGAFYDQYTDRLYVASHDGANGVIHRKFSSSTDGIFSYSTRVVRRDRPTNPGFMMATASSYGWFRVRVFADGAQIALMTPTSEAPIPLPGDYKARDFYVTIEPVVDRSNNTDGVQGIFLAEDASDFP